MAPDCSRHRRCRRRVVLAVDSGLNQPPFSEPPSLTAGESSAVLAGLLHNIYRAFDRRDESVVYDRLARSIDGDLLTDVYIQTRQSMELENQGGARVKVTEVELLEAEAESTQEDGGFVCRCAGMSRDQSAIGDMCISGRINTRPS